MTNGVIFVADSTSQLRPAWLVAKELGESLGLPVRCNIVPNQSIRARSQLDDIGVTAPSTNWSIPRLVEQPEFFESLVVVVYLAASRIFRLRRQSEIALSRRPRSRRPLFVTGYNGVVFERHIEGLAWRLGYDFICVNSRRDERIFSEHLHSLGQVPDTLVRTGLPLAQVGRRASVHSDCNGTGSLLFATQHIVPIAHRERVYLLRSLAQLARARPDRKIVVKPRSRPGQQTLHKEKYHYETLLRDEIKRPPRNLVVEYGPLHDFLPTTSILATVSSTAALEAISHGTPAAVLTDLGVKESLGNHFFLGSGMFTTLRKLQDFEPPVPDQSWLDDNGLGGEESLERLVAAVDAALREQRNAVEMRPLVPTYYGPDRSPGLDQMVMWPTPEPGSSTLPTHVDADSIAPAPSDSSVAARVRAKLGLPARARFGRGRSSGTT